ncbi:unnamed protein product [Strongylus vulgaris]|uniref:ZP domain-containing protein n=1 Tax=Strongylus vulgaris TaxID=40348 RepID=A0A3P7IWF7_STRVU|nr:unnamed protein product [Strongylus vulgaris]
MKLFFDIDNVLKNLFCVLLHPASGTALDVVLYYSIRCNPQAGYCLSVANCKKICFFYKGVVIQFLGTISSDEAGFQPYSIIDQSGCSLEPSLYDNVTVITFDGINKVTLQLFDIGSNSLEQLVVNNHKMRVSKYESSFTAGIRNPYPVRFRSSSGAVLLYCVTTLIPTEMDGACPRSECANHNADS